MKLGCGGSVDADGRTLAGGRRVTDTLNIEGDESMSITVHVLSFPREHCGRGLNIPTSENNDRGEGRM